MGHRGKIRRQGDRPLTKRAQHYRDIRLLPPPLDASFSGWLFRTGRLQIWLPLVVTLVYLIAGGVWIAVSDRLILQAADTPETLGVLQTYKGWLFVGVTGLLLFAILTAACHRIMAGQEAALETLDRLDLALTAAHGGVWDRDLRTGSFYLSPYLKTILGFDPDAPITPADWRVLIHPDDLDTARRETRALLRGPDDTRRFEYRIRHRDGKFLWLNVMGHAIRETDGQPVRMIGVAIDVTAVKSAEERVQQLAYYDTLTGLPNRALFKEELTRWLDNATAETETLLVARLDLDRFMEVNSELGSDRGDEVLMQVGQRLRAACRTGGLVARLGSDEFAILLPAAGSLEAIQSDVEHLQTAIGEPFAVAGQHLELTASVGVTVYPWDGDTAEGLMTNADLALSQARGEGDRRLRFYARGMNEAFQARTMLARDLQSAVRDGKIDVHFQPVLSAADEDVAGFEALARWPDPVHGDVPPKTFIPLAEELGIVQDIGILVLREACRQIAEWNDRFGRALFIAVNVSPQQLNSGTLDTDVAGILTETGLSAAALELEITENALMENIDLAAETLGRLRHLDISIAIDDFGTGYSNLVALRRLPVSRLKIDRAFTHGYGADPENTAIVDSIIDLAESLDLHVTAEGVEQSQQLSGLQSKGCGHVQGFLFGPAQPAGEIENGLLQGQPDASAGDRGRTAGGQPGDAGH